MVRNYLGKDEQRDAVDAFLDLKGPETAPYPPQVGARANYFPEKRVGFAGLLKAL
jgi:hypothetical protein